MKSNQTESEVKDMKYYKLKFEDGTFKIVKGKTSLDIIRKYDLCTREHVNTRMVELSGEQLAIAINNESGV